MNPVASRARSIAPDDAEAYCGKPLHLNLPVVLYVFFIDGVTAEGIIRMNSGLYFELTFSQML